MLKIKKNSEKDDMVIRNIDKIIDQLKKNRKIIFYTSVVIIFLAFFGEEVLGRWFSDIAEFFRGVSMFIFFIAYMSFKSKKTLKSKIKKDKNFNNGVLSSLEEEINNPFLNDILGSLKNDNDKFYKEKKDSSRVKKDILYNKSSLEYNVQENYNGELISGE